MTTGNFHSHTDIIDESILTFLATQNESTHPQKSATTPIPMSESYKSTNLVNLHGWATVGGEEGNVEEGFNKHDDC